MRKIKSFLIIICLLSIYAASFYGCGKKERSDSPNNETELPEIVIGSDNYPPYNYVDTDGNATGIDVELATEAFKRMGYKARFIYIDWEDKKNLLADRTDEHIPAVWSLIALQKRELIYPFLSKGYADALAAHETAICQYMKDYNIEFRILDEPLETVGLGVAFDKNDDRGIERQLTEVLNQMRNDGTEKKIISRYISDADKYLEVDSYGK